MKLFEIPMVVTSLVGLGFLVGLGAPPARANFTFGEPALYDIGPGLVNSFSADGLEMYIMQGAGQGGSGRADIWVCKRALAEDDWGPPENLGPLVNSAGWEEGAFISADSLELYFLSDRSGGYGQDDLYVTKRATRTSPWGPATNVGPKVNTSHVDDYPSLSPDGLELYFNSNRPGGYGHWDIYVSKRATPNDPWGDPVNLGPVVNSPDPDFCAVLLPDGLSMLFASGRPGGYGSRDIWMTRRASRSAPWEPPVNLGPIVNGPFMESPVHLTPDGSALCFLRTDAANNISTWTAPILPPIVDFNGDGKVDEKDLIVMTPHWGQDYPPCDVGPFGWGDGVVDGQDWVVLMETIEGPGFVLSPKPHATEVPRDVILSWTLPKFAKAQDVYFGASLEDVRSASRSDPRGVLVSKAQMATAYESEGLLEFSRTYYWRVDFVVPGPTPTVYQGPVLDFTTVAFAYPIKNISATASSAQAGSGPEGTVDGSGLDTSDGHSTDVKEMWWTLPTSPHWIQYEFDKVYTLHEMWVWNFNMIIEPSMGFGAKTVKIEYSTDGTTWTSLANVPEFAKAPGKAGYTANTIVSFAAVPTKFVKLTIEENWGVAPQTGLSEVRFFAIQTAAVSP